MKKVHSSEIACYELENIKLDKLVSKYVSDTQSPCLVMLRELRSSGVVIYSISIASPVDNHRLLIKQFTNLSDVSLWLCTNERFKDFVCLNYTHLC